MTDEQAIDLYEFIQTKLKNADLQYLHGFAYDISNAKEQTTKESFLLRYIEEIIGQMRMFQTENFNGIISRLNQSIQGSPIRSLKVDLNHNEQLMSNSESIDLTESINLDDLTSTFKKIHQEIINDRNRGRNFRI
ncbi:hypothetical protein LVD17_00035 [Fulvivirga ulvae]|uniref:hypothetical protein n=1 Tax=Fulvivirga ulvae TaxID=2904245 RepID=UPI001F32932C|nr:hypothetical protein [Fulvivirga ulvae]UII32192.1 hypothetical protein LVD17_28305 [Fulvivirga ulvae]UII32224.1 hypothetical protein LVD17_00035 [Fulvivirga ulvae]